MTLDALAAKVDTLLARVAQLETQVQALRQPVTFSAPRRTWEWGTMVHCPRCGMTHSPNVTCLAPTLSTPGVSIHMLPSAEEG